MLIDMKKAKKFNISEIFYSIQGEGTRAGLPCVFIRFQGCELRCNWCDTPYALEIKQREQLLSFEEIIENVKKYNCNFVMFTGGEPLYHKGVNELIKWFCDNNYTVVIETNGHQPISDIDSRANFVMDIKCPSSKMDKFNNYENFKFLKKDDEVKFVIMNREDFDFAVDIIIKYDLNKIIDNILFSPVFGVLEPLKLAEWILKENLRVRMQLQIHKYIWHPTTRGV